MWILIICNNLVFVYDYFNEVKEKIDKEILLGWIVGFFDIELLFNLRLLFIGVVVKKDGGWCLIYYFLYFVDFSVNDFIDLEVCFVYYIFFDEVLEMVGLLGKGVVLGKMDVKLVFRLLLVYFLDY